MVREGGDGVGGWVGWGGGHRRQDVLGECSCVCVCGDVLFWVGGRGQGEERDGSWCR